MEEPTSFDEVVHNPTAVRVLRNLAKVESLPHIMLSGPQGVGKRTLVRLFLRERYGRNGAAFNPQKVTQWFSPQRKQKEVPVTMMASPYHYQLKPQAHNVYDKLLLQMLLTEVLEYRSMYAHRQSYRVIVVEDADTLSIEAQESLKKVLEDNVRSCRFIFLNNKTGFMNPAMLSRCMHVQLSPPSKKELMRLCKPYSLTATQKSCVYRTVSVHDALCTIQQATTGIAFTDPIETACDDIIAVFKKETRSIDAVIEFARKKMYELKNYTVSLRALLRRLTHAIIIQMASKRAVPYEKMYQVAVVAADVDETIQFGNKKVYHMERFIIHVLRLFHT